MGRMQVGLWASQMTRMWETRKQTGERCVEEELPKHTEGSSRPYLNTGLRRQRVELHRARENDV